MILDASVFSRALPWLDQRTLGRLKEGKEEEVVVGRGTSMRGDFLRNLKGKTITAASTLPGGKVFELAKDYPLEESLGQVKVAAGATFEAVIDSLGQMGLAPAIFPLYDKGTVGGFVATNGSGFGSYKYGFVRYSRTLGVLLDRDTVAISVVPYSELIEVDKENEFAWSAIWMMGKYRYYIPKSYAEALGIDGRKVELRSLLSELRTHTRRMLEQGYIPVALRYALNSRAKVEGLQIFERILAYIVRYNSPSVEEVALGRIKADDLEKLFDFLKANQDVLPFPSMGEYEEHHKLIMSRFKLAKRVPREFRELQSEFMDASRCINCSLCLDSCLAFSTTKNPEDSPMGRFDRMMWGWTNFRPCLGCMECQDSCPQGIKIASIVNSLPKLSPTDERRVRIEKVTPRVMELQSSLEEKFKNRPLFLLFAGCAPQYDPDGVEGFLTFLDQVGESLPNSLSPRVKVIDGSCCGFDNYVQGDEKGAREAVVTIVKRMQEEGANGVYFLCPEGLFTYNTMGGKEGHLAFETMRGMVKNVHFGCWARRLGMGEGEFKCAASFFVEYGGRNVEVGKEEKLTLCPFSTWKFGTKSVYDSFILSRPRTKLPSLDEDLRKLILASVADAVVESGDELASKVGQLGMGGEAFYKVLSVQIFRKNLSKAIPNRVRGSPLLAVARDSPRELELGVERVMEQIRNDVGKGEFPNQLREKISTSRALDYKYKGMVDSPMFLDLLRKVLTEALTEQPILDALRRAMLE